ncbi:hypothetical protein NL676_027309 [Syzygium grande]|nr:hypothetical protein NL676_027309 [Syzygium grande]
MTGNGDLYDRRLDDSSKNREYYGQLGTNRDTAKTILQQLTMWRLLSKSEPVCKQPSATAGDGEKIWARGNSGEP